LKELTQLQMVHVNGTQVTSAGVDALKEALPNCTIARGDRKVRGR
jgi:hypothetical protein